MLCLNRFNHTPVIMASGRELCYVLLVGIFMCYFMSFIILSKPTKTVCTVLRIGLGLCLSLCYSAILTKTNRISRIFNQGRKSIKRPKYTSPKSQVAISVGEYYNGDSIALSLSQMLRVSILKRIFVLLSWHGPSTYKASSWVYLQKGRGGEWTCEESKHTDETLKFRGGQIFELEICCLFERATGLALARIKAQLAERWCFIGSTFQADTICSSPHCWQALSLSLSHVHLHKTD